MPNKTRESVALIFSHLIIVFSSVVYLIFAHLYLNGHLAKSDEFRIYALSFAIVPIFSVVVYWALFTSRQIADEYQNTFRIGVFLCLNGVFVLFLLLSIVTGRFSRHLLLACVIAQVGFNSLAHFAFGALMQQKLVLSPIVDALQTAIITLLPPAFLLLVLVGSTQDILNLFFDKTTGFLGLSYSKFFMAGMGVFGVIVLSSLFVYGRDRTSLACCASRAFLTIVGVIAVAWIISAIFVSPNPDVQTLNAHLGPVACVIGKGVPLVNVFCQYGMLSFLVFNAVFLVIPPSYIGAAFVVSFLNAVYFTVLFLILRKVLNNRFLAYAVTAMLGLAWIVLGSNAIPAAGAMRFLPQLALLLSLVYLPATRIFGAFSIAAAAVSSLWSFEGLAWSLVTYFSFIVAEYLMIREKRTGLFRSLVKCAAIFAIPHVVYSLFVLIVYGVLPSYQVYFDLIFNMYAGGHQAGWSYPVDPKVLIWVIAPLTYLPVYACSAWLIFRRHDQKWLDPTLFARVLLPTAILGGIELSYWVGRSMFGPFWGVTIPYVIVIAVAIDRLLPATWRIKSHAPAISCLVSGALLYSSCLAWALRNSQLGVLFNRDYLKASVAMALHSPQKEIHDERIAQAVELIQQWSPRSPEVLIVMPGSIAGAALLYTGKGNRLHISNSQSDGNSILLHRHIIAFAGESIHEGDLLFTHEDVRRQMYADYTINSPAPDGDNSFSALEIEAMFKLREHWRMSVVDRTALGFLVLRLTEKNTANFGPNREYSLEPKSKS